VRTTKTSPSPKKVKVDALKGQEIIIDGQLDEETNPIYAPLEQLQKVTTIDEKNWIPSRKKLKFNEDIENKMTDDPFDLTQETESVRYIYYCFNHQEQSKS
jgi:hypothetical protein